MKGKKFINVLVCLLMMATVLTVVVPVNSEFTSPEAKLIASDAAAYDEFGWSAAISGDTAILAAPKDDDAGPNSGSAYIFMRDTSTTPPIWTQRAKLTASDAEADDYFGWSVSISGDTAIVGSYWDDDSGYGSGSAYVYQDTSIEGDWSSYSETKLIPNDGASGDMFGRSVSISGDIAVIGASEDDDAALNSGSAYVFVRDTSTTPPTWTQEDKIVAIDGQKGDMFGISVSVHGDTILVGAYYDDDACPTDILCQSGSAYVFVRDTSTTPPTWNLQAKLTASDAAANDYFGFSVSVSGDTALVGAWGDDIFSDPCGSAYIFMRDASTMPTSWSQKNKLVASDAVGPDLFGMSVSIDGDTATIGAPGEDDAGINSGSTYTYQDTSITGDWSSYYEMKLTPTDGAAGDTFGRHVSISGDTALIASIFDDDGGSKSGSAYVFDIPPPVPDTTPPVITIPDDIVAEATSAHGAIVTFTVTAVDDEDGPVPVTTSPYYSGYTFPFGTTAVTCSATDSAGNTAYSSFSITVVDTTTPVITVPSNMIVEATSSAGAMGLFTVSAYDLVDGMVPVTTSANSGDVFDLGTTTVTCTATDAAGNTASSSFTITVVDTTSPVITVPEDIVAEATSAQGATVTYTVTAYDLVDGPVPVTTSESSGDVFQIGTTTVTCTATDAAGNTASSSFTVTVVDTTSPVIDIHIVYEATSPQGAAIPFTVTAYDLYEGSISVSSDPSPGDYFPVGTTTITYSALDSFGNTVISSFTVTVVDTTPPVLTLIGEPVVFLIIGEAYNDEGAIASDIVDGDLTSSVVVDNPVDTTTSGIYIVTYDVEDSSGNIAAQIARTVIVFSPEDATQDLISMVESLGLSYGLKTSLKSKLENAVKSIANDRPAAEGQLSAFINEVETYRGDELTNEEADELIGTAQWIIDNL